MDFAARWPDLPESPNLSSSERAAISNSYADTQAAADAEEQMPLTWPVTEAGRAGQQQDPAGQAAFGSVFLAGALALGSLSLVGGVFAAPVNGISVIPSARQRRLGLGIGCRADQRSGLDGRRAYGARYAYWLPLCP